MDKSIVTMDKVTYKKFKKAVKSFKKSLTSLFGWSHVGELKTSLKITKVHKDAYVIPINFLNIEVSPNYDDTDAISDLCELYHFIYKSNGTQYYTGYYKYNIYLDKKFWQSLDTLDFVNKKYKVKG
jgi:hypothetical protein